MDLGVCDRLTVGMMYEQYPTARIEAGTPADRDDKRIPACRPRARGGGRKSMFWPTACHATAKRALRGAAVRPWLCLGFSS